MLNVSDAMTAGAVRCYFENNGHDYYIDGQNPPGIWSGELAKEWGLEGKLVEKTHFDRAADGYHPISGEDLVLRRGETRRAEAAAGEPEDFLRRAQRAGRKTIGRRFEDRVMIEVTAGVEAGAARR